MKNDNWIRAQIAGGMLSPAPMSLISKDGNKKVISYGVSSYGYDLRIDRDFVLFRQHHALLDPKNYTEEGTERITADSLILQPGQFALAKSVEYVRMPRDVIGVCVGKSTYARIGLIINVTPIEPEWEGHITLELSNTAPRPILVYAREGIGQLLFLESSELCQTSYADRKGKYQSQTGVTPARC